MAEDLRTFENPKNFLGDEGYFVRFTRSAVQENKHRNSFIYKDGTATIKSVRIEDEIKLQKEDSDTTYAFTADDIIDIRKGDDTLLWVNFNYVCPVCGLNDNLDHHHLIKVESNRDRPLALVIDIQHVYDHSGAKAQFLAGARAEMKQYFPDKQFEIQPSRMMLRREGENGVLLGEAHVATYIAFEV